MHKRHMHMRWVVGVLAAGAAAMLVGQAAAPALVFDVASIRPASPPTPETMRSGQFHAGQTIEGTRLDFGFTSLADLLPYSFRVRPYQISAPSWTNDSRWNILAKLPEGTTSAQVPEMMQALLAERFKLAVHHEKREQQVYELTVAPGGPKVEVSTGGEFKMWDGSFPGFNFGSGILNGGATVSGRIVDQPNCGQRWEFIPLSMDAFAGALSMFLDRPVLNQTGLKGDYKVTLDINAETMMAITQNMARARGLPPPPGPGGEGGGRGGTKGAPGPPPPPPPGGGRGGDGRGPGPDVAALAQCLQAAAEQGDGSTGMVLQAVQKLGLKLQQTRAPIDTVVVDHLEKSPTEN